MSPDSMISLSLVGWLLGALGVISAGIWAVYIFFDKKVTRAEGNSAGAIDSLRREHDAKITGIENHIASIRAECATRADIHNLSESIAGVHGRLDAVLIALKK